MKKIIYGSLWILMLLFSHVSWAENVMLERGEGMFVFHDPVNSEIKPVEVHYCIPENVNVEDCPIIFVFQGNDRDYTYLLDAWGKVARERHFMVFIPQFPMKDFPLYLYQEVGAMNKDHTQVTSPEKTTASMVDRLFEYVKGHVKTHRNDYEIYGHSAGGQFVQRFMLTHDSPYVSRAVVGSPGWYTFPDTTLNYSYGIKNLPTIDSLALKRWLAKDIVIQTAECDTVREWFLRKTPEADAQGRDRLERGLRFYDYCRQLAVSHHWPFRWREKTVPGIGHESVPMGMDALDMLLQPTDAVIQTPTMMLDDKKSIASYQAVLEYLKALAEKHPSGVSYRKIGVTPQGREVVALRIGKDAKGKKLRVWVQGGLHGNEPAPVDAVCLLVKYLLETEEGQTLVQQLDIECLAVANPDGYDNLQRKSGNGLDLNRDMTKMSDPMTVLLKKEWVSFRPDVSFDIHEFNPRRKEIKNFYGEDLETNYDVLLMTSGHPNINTQLKGVQQHMFVPSMSKALNRNGYTYAPYFTPHVAKGQMKANLEAKSPQSSATWNALAGSVSLFAEIKGIGYGRNLFEKRMMIGFTLAKEVLTTAQTHKYEIMKVTRPMVTEKVKRDTMVVTAFGTQEKNVRYSFLNLKDGKLEVKEMIGADARHPMAITQRRRPRGYLLQPSCRMAVEKLKALGVEVQTVDARKNFKVEYFVPHHVKRQKKEWEGIHPVSLHVNVDSRNVQANNGWYFVSTQQAMGDLIVTLLEPECANGYAAFEVLPVKEGKYLSWFRVMD